MWTWTALLGASLSLGCRPPEQVLPVGGEQPGNVLVILSDDIGIDKTAVYGEHPTPARTPNIDALAAQGLLFRHAYSQPTCSPSRASLLTGRHPTRHGIGRWIYANSETHALPEDELTIPELLAYSEQSWSTRVVGKWHLTGFQADSPATHPLDAGFDGHAGSLANPLEAIQEGNTPRGYDNWEKATDGEVAWTTDYMTTDTFEDAIAALGELEEPWFLLVASNAAHTPYHSPPAELLDEALAEDPTPLEQYKAMVQVLDGEIGRLLDAIPSELRERTTIVYTTDNGTPADGDLIEPPWDPSRSKQTVYEGGVNVPLIVAGPLVAQPGSECQALVSQVDLLPTVAELAGIDLATVTVPSGPAQGAPLVLDGHSLLPFLADPQAESRHEVVFAEQFFPNGEAVELEWRDRMVRSRDWKLVRSETWTGREQYEVTHELFRMEEGAWDEGLDLLAQGELDPEAQAAYDSLLAELDARALALAYGHGS